jgi:hypothetical protein
MQKLITKILPIHAFAIFSRCSPFELNDSRFYGHAMEKKFQSEITMNILTTREGRRGGENN